MAKGWINESMRHQMSAYGIPSGRKSQFTPKRVGKKYMLIDNNTKQFLIGYSFDSKKDAEAFPEEKKEPAMVVSLLDNVHNSIKYDDPKVANDMMNDVKRSIRAEKDLDFLNMDGRTMAYSILSDAQEELSRGNKKNALLFVKQAQDLYQGNYKKEGHEITFKDGQVAIF